MKHLGLNMSIPDKLKDHILESIAEGVFTVDKDFKINFFNRAAEKITGQNQTEVLGKFCKNVLKSKVCAYDCPISTVLIKKKNLYDFATTIVDKNGEKIPIKLNASVLYNETGEPSGGIISFRDMSELEKISLSMKKENHFYGIVAGSKKMKEIFSLIEEVGPTDAPVLIQGESGTGKELIANAIQKISTRKNAPYIKINCSVIPANLLASELFGHVKGAFTDAVKTRPGRFEIANNGTIFLDEVAETSPQMQIQLLRVLQEGTFERVGESITRYTNVRVIGATNIDVKEALKSGKFREDLYYRLNVIPIEVPPLRERKDDIVLLANDFLREFSRYYKKEINYLDEESIDLLMNYSWPGNVRELKNVIEYSFVRTIDKNFISASKFPPILRKKDEAVYFPIAHRELMESTQEKEELQNLLKKHRYNRSSLAKELNIGRTTLWRRLKRVGIA